jgi:uncharacterized protein YndB with AHSA1/START domain
MEDESGIESGMISEVVVSEWPNHISIKHLGLVMNGIEDYESEEVKLWTPAFENYTFVSHESGQCVFKMVQDIPEFYETEFRDNWNKAFDLIEERLSLWSSSPVFITLEARSKHSPATLWTKLTQPELVKTWNFASEDWHCPNAKNDLRVGGEFHYEMAAKDGSMSFDFWGTYTKIEENKRLEFTLGDGRKVSIELFEKPHGTLVVERFEPEHENSHHLQRQGWQAILNNLVN